MLRDFIIFQRQIPGLPPQKRYISARDTTGAEPGDKEPDKDRPDATDTWRHGQRDSFSTSTPGAPGNPWNPAIRVDLIILIAA